MAEKENKKAAPVFEKNESDQLIALAGMLDQIAHSVRSSGAAASVQHAERGKMDLQSVLSHVSAELESLAAKRQEKASVSQEAAPGGEKP